MENVKHKFGYIALAGPPNAGKSTLMNELVGEKISIISRRPQTTRHRILGIMSQPEFQIAFVDTPGLHSDQKKILNKVINRTAVTSLLDVDLVLFLIDTHGWNDELLKSLKIVVQSEQKVILLINKIDKLKDKSALLKIIEDSTALHDFREIIPISALKLDNKDTLLKTLISYLPDGPPGFPHDQVSDRSEKFLASEFIREQTFLLLGKEVPYSIAVEVTRYEKNEKNIILIDATLWVEKPGQKSIVIGKGGEQLKKIGSAARKQLEYAIGQKIYLSLWVKVKKGWADREVQLRALGYNDV